MQNSGNERFTARHNLSGLFCLVESDHHRRKEGRHFKMRMWSWNDDNFVFCNVVKSSFFKNVWVNSGKFRTKQSVVICQAAWEQTKIGQPESFSFPLRTFRLLMCFHLSSCPPSHCLYTGCSNVFTILFFLNPRNTAFSGGF